MLWQLKLFDSNPFVSLNPETPASASANKIPILPIAIGGAAILAAVLLLGR